MAAGRPMGRWGLFVFLAILVVLAFTSVTALGVPAEPYDSTAKCLQCHDAVNHDADATDVVSHVNFNVSTPVNRASACPKCHWEGTDHPYHNQTVASCGSCHAGWGVTLPTNMPKVYTANGFFNTAASADMSAGQLHVIHNNPTWAGAASINGRQCASCHAAANCSVCHEGVDTTHANHTLDAKLGDFWPTAAPDGRVHANSSTDEYVLDTNSKVSCSNPTCHEIGAASIDPYKVEENATSTASGTTVYSQVWKGTWSRLAGGAYSAAAYKQSASLNASVTLTFNGMKVEWIGDKAANRGKAQVYIDGVAVGAPISQYSATAAQQVALFTSDVLSEGSHTISVKVLAQKDAAATANTVLVDCFRVYPKIAMPVVTSCADTGCHQPDNFSGITVDRTAKHGAPIALHTATGDFAGSIPTSSTGTSGSMPKSTHGLPVTVNVPCTDCHNGVINTEHETTKSGAMSCSDCHQSSQMQALDTDTSVEQWNKNCSACHSTHSGAGNAHNFLVADDLSCGYGNGGSSCHDTQHIDQIHSNAATSTPTLVSNCTVCHRNGADGTVIGLKHGDTPVTTCEQCHANPHGVTWNHLTVQAASDPCYDCHPTPPDPRPATKDVKLVHQSNCDECHANPRYPTIKAAGRNECADCHNTTIMTKDYSTDALHYAGTVATHTASIAQGVVAYDGGMACSSCHLLEMKSEHDKAVSRTSVDGPINCRDCHTASYYPRVAWVATKQCSACHATGKAPVAHHAYSTKHNFSSTSSACAGADCHNVTDAAAPHSRSAAKCTACHTSNTTVPTNTNCWTGCHGSSSSYHPSTATNHTSVAAECLTCHPTYSDITAGHGTCAKCHANATLTAAGSNLGARYTSDCNSCHNASVLGGHAYTPASTNHYPTTLHTAASMTNTVNEGGTASATCSQCHATVLQAAHTNLPGSVTINCTQCHTYSAPVTAVITGNWANDLCTDCHKSGVLPATKIAHITGSTVATGTSAGQSCGNTGTGCHTTYNLHALHKNAAGGCSLTDAGGSKCHDFGQQALKPSVLSCGQGGGAGSCHAAYTDTTAHYPAANHAPTNSLQAADTTYQGIACQSCHIVSVGENGGGTAGGLYGEHALSTSAKTGDADLCRNCHANTLSQTAIGNKWSAKNGTTACASCHTSTMAIHADTASAKHSDTASAGCSDGGAGCHGTSQDLSLVGTPSASNNTAIHTTCLRCHDKSGVSTWTAAGQGNMKWDPAKHTCGGASNATSCHTSAKYTASVHNIGGTNVNGDDATKHAATLTVASYSGVVYGSTSCTTCHSAGMKTAHATSSSGAISCTGCHSSAVIAGSATVVKASWPNRLCTDCHTGAVTHQSYMTGASTWSSNHKSTSTGCANTGAGCHNTDELGALHPNIGCTASGTGGACHDVRDKNMSSVPKTCGAGSGGCHTGASYTLSTHYPTANHAPTNTVQAADTSFQSISCNSCHIVQSTDNGGGLGGGLEGEHDLASSARTVSPSDACKNCHNFGGSVQTVITANWTAKSGAGACAACHTGSLAIHASGVNTAAHSNGTNNGCANSGNGCHPTADISSAGLHSTCLRCHDRTGVATWTTPGQGNVKFDPNKKSCGGASNATGCHTSNEYPSSAGSTQFVHQASQVASITGNDAAHHVASSASMSSTSAATTYQTGPGNRCGDCHSAALLKAHTGPTTAMDSNRSWTGTNYCTSCHNSQSVEASSVAVVKTNWTAKTCDACHVTNGHGKHLTYETSHTATPGAGCTLGTCHGGGQTDVRAIHNVAGRGCTATGSDSLTATVGCHDLDKVMPSGTMSCGQGGTGDTKCHVSHTSGNHGSAAHTLDQAASTYNNTTQTGCAGAGVACHGATIKTTYTDTAYHPIQAPQCTSSKCHNALATNHSDPQFDDPNSCQDCHGGGAVPYPPAQAVSNLLESPANGGHFNETSHTAANLYSTYASQGGTAKASCAQCHNPIDPLGGISYLRYQHQNLNGSSTVDITCSGCHNYNAATQQEVTTKWPAKDCAGCHNATDLPLKAQHSLASTVVTGTAAGQSCGATGAGCHTTYDLHSLHKNAAGGCGLADAGGSKCHDFSVQGMKPTTKSCGSGGGAGSCHASYVSDGLPHYPTASHAPTNTVQASDTSYQSIACQSCHIISSTEGGGGLGGGLYAEHNAATSAKTVNAGNLCRNCHNFSSVPQVATTIAGSWAQKSGATACSACHVTATALAIHTDAASAKHSDTASTGCTDGGAGCHGTSQNLSLVGAPSASVSTAIHSTCLRCHDKSGVATWTAAGQGNMKWDPAKHTCGGASNATSCHTSASYTAAAHNITGTNVNGDDVAKHSALTSVTANPTVYSGGQACTVCHSATLKTAHATTNLGSAVTCVGCHSSSVIGTAATVVKSSWPGRKCTDCHASQHLTYQTGASTYSANHKSTSTSCANTGTGCHNTDELGALHPNAGCTASGPGGACHSLNKAMTSVPKTCGNGSGGCHTGTQYTTSAHYTAVNHAITGTLQTSDTSFSSTACSSCHIMADTENGGGLNGGLEGEHSLTTSAKSVNGTDVCKNCHGYTAVSQVATVISSKWTQKSTATACSACHVTATALAIHASGVNAAAHSDGTNNGCASSGAGCHPTSDISQVGTPSTTANIHTSCLRCHDKTGVATWSAPGQGNMKWDPAKHSCGGSSNATGCHLSTSYTATQHRIGLPDVVNGDDAGHHVAASMNLTISGTNVYTDGTTACTACHASSLLDEHSADNTSTISSLGANTCAGCHNSTVVTLAPTQVKAGWTNDKCQDCHPTIHTTWNNTAHVGTPNTGLACGSGANNCHTDANGVLELGKVHAKVKYYGCADTGCHDGPGDNENMSTATKTCGGTTSGTGCHDANGPGSQKTNIDGHTTHLHPADTQATGGPAISTAQTGCFGNETSAWGCHFKNLEVEHAQRITTSTTKHGRTTGVGCGVCHTDKGGTPGYFAQSISAIGTAITGHNRNCTGCHTDTAATATTGAGAPHQSVTTAASIIRSQSDPVLEFQNWPSGGGHNIGVTGTSWPKGYASVAITGSDGTVVTHTGSLAFSGSYVTPWTSTSMVKCSDCHYATTATGPQGAAVKYFINGSAGTSTFPVTNSWADNLLSSGNPPLCAKCHSALSSSVHGKSAHKTATMKCANCHVRIPHAWKRPRLLRRVVGGTSVQPLDAAPYNLPADNTYGTTAYILSASQTDFGTNGSCVTAGCGGHNNGVTTGTFWP